MRKRISKKQLEKIDKGSNRDSFVPFEDSFREQKEKRKIDIKIRQKEKKDAYRIYS